MMATKLSIGVFIVVILNIKISYGTHQLQCTKVNSCKCTSSQGVIDLSPLDACAGQSSCTTPKFLDQYATDGSGDQFSFNPCTAFTEGSCSNVESCQVRAGYQYPTGTQDSVTFNTDPTKGLQLVATSTDSTQTARTSAITLVCDANTEGTLSPLGEDPAGSASNTMTLTSKYCCPQGQTTLKPLPKTTTVDHTSTTRLTSTTTRPSTMTTTMPSTTIKPTSSSGKGQLCICCVISIMLLCIIFVCIVGKILIKLCVKRKSNASSIPKKRVYWTDFPAEVKVTTLPQSNDSSIRPLKEDFYATSTY